jgi:hypothetical protein
MIVAGLITLIIINMILDVSSVVGIDSTWILLLALSFLMAWLLHKVLKKEPPIICEDSVVDTFGI